MKTKQDKVSPLLKLIYIYIFIFFLPVISSCVSKMLHS